MKSPGDRAIEAFYNMWKYWEETGNFPMEDYLSSYGNDFKGFGSGMSEVWRGRHDMRTYSEELLENKFRGFLIKPNG